METIPIPAIVFFANTDKKHLFSQFKVKQGPTIGLFLLIRKKEYKKNNVTQKFVKFVVSALKFRKQKKIDALKIHFSFVCF